MTSDASKDDAQGEEQALNFVIDALAQRNTMLFRPIGTSTEVDLAVRGGDGQYLEVRVRSAARGTRTFELPRLRDRPNLFVVCVVWDGGEPATPSDCWVLPAHLFDRLPGRAGKATPPPHLARPGGKAHRALLPPHPLRRPRPGSLGGRRDY